MCGIAYKHNFDGTPVNNEILQQFDAQRSRGVQGFGLFDGEYMHMVKSASEDKILKWLVKYDSNLIMFHHRYPTSTVNVARAAHPMSTHDYFGNVQYIMVHNGVIRNSEDLWLDHCERGIEYKTMLDDLTFNDSESLLWDLALTLEGKQKEMKSIGDMAFVILKKVDGRLDKMYFGRKGRPLNMWRTKDTIELSSEGRGDEIPVDVLHTWGYQSKRLTTKPMTFTQYKPYVSQYNNACGYRGMYGATDWEDEYFDDHGHYPQTYMGLDDDDDFERHDYGKSKGGSWLGDGLRKKFQKYLDNGDVKVGKLGMGDTYAASSTITDNGDGTYDEVASSKPEHYIVEKDGSFHRDENEPIDFDDIIDQIDEFEPSTAAVQSLAIEYLTQWDGHFENAYWSLEKDYGDTADLPDTIANIREKMLLEATMRFIESDPEYENEDSISSMWGALWATI